MLLEAKNVAIPLFNFFRMIPGVCAKKKNLYLKKRSAQRPGDGSSQHVGGTKAKGHFFYMDEAPLLSLE